MNEHRRHPRSKTSSGQAEPLIQTVARTIGHAAGKLTRLTQEFVGKTASGASDLSQSQEFISHPIENQSGSPTADHSDRSRRRVPSSEKKESETKQHSKPKANSPRARQQPRLASKK